MNFQVKIKIKRQLEIFPYQKDTQIFQLKQEIVNKLQQPQERIKLSFQGNSLHDNQFIKDLNLQPSSYFILNLINESLLDKANASKINESQKFEQVPEELKKQEKTQIQKQGVEWNFKEFQQKIEIKQIIEISSQKKFKKMMKTLYKKNPKLVFMIVQNKVQFLEYLRDFQLKNLQQQFLTEDAPNILQICQQFGYPEYSAITAYFLENQDREQAVNCLASQFNQNQFYEQKKTQVQTSQDQKSQIEIKQQFPLVKLDELQKTEIKFAEENQQQYQQQSQQQQSQQQQQFQQNEDLFKSEIISAAEFYNNQDQSDSIKFEESIFK